ncbi:MAG: alpha/beta hydrolase, partial [Thermomicrobiales bacterium]|nr:alpha/beta hydrolase [Thermomicrobiales bacterium]
LWVMPWMFSPTFMARHADVAQALAQESPYPATAAGLIAQAAAVMAHDALPRLGQVAAPTLVLSGAEDILTPAAGAQVLADAIPGAHLHILERGAHVADAEYPDAVSAAMLAFLLGE